MRIVVVLLTLSAIALATGTAGSPDVLGPIWADHDTGNCKLTITAFGGVGYTNLPPPNGPGQGIGFRFPKTGTTSYIFYCGMLCGNDSSYVVDRFYGQKPSVTIDSEFAIVESLHRDDRYGGQEYSAAMNDSRHAHPKGLVVREHSIALPEPYGNGVIIIYDYWNNGSSPLNGMYAGLWSDFDIGNGGAADGAYTDSARRLAYVRASAGENPTCGLVVLAPTSASNVSGVFHPTWVYPDSCVSKYQKIRWLNGTLHESQGAASNDWSVIVAVGPGNIEVGEAHRCAFGVLAATSVAELVRKSDSLQAWYDASIGIEYANRGTPMPVLLTVSPNPISGTARITFGAPIKGPARLSLYDATGRVVGNLWHDNLDGKTTTLDWNGRDVGRRKLNPGVYFLRLQGEGLEQTTKTILTR